MRAESTRATSSTSTLRGGGRENDIQKYLSDIFVDPLRLGWVESDKHKYENKTWAWNSIYVFLCDIQLK